MDDYYDALPLSFTKVVSVSESRFFASVLPPEKSSYSLDYLRAVAVSKPARRKIFTLI